MAKSRYQRAREAYIENPTRSMLRLFLIQKAKRGKWDDRYCRYYKVDPNVSYAARRFIMRAYARGLVPTDTLRPKGSSGSFHAQRNGWGEGLGVDVGLIERHIGTSYGRAKMVAFQKAEHSAFAAGDRPTMVELIGPDNGATVLRGQRTDLAEGTQLENQHDNHVHAGFRR